MAFIFGNTPGPAKRPLIKSSSFSPASVQSSNDSVDSKDDGVADLSPTKKHGKKALSPDDIPKVRKQLGRDSYSSLAHLLRHSVRPFTGQSIVGVHSRCNFHRIHSKVRRHFGNCHSHGTSGDIATDDIFFHVKKSRQFPAAAFTETVPRYFDGAILEDVTRPSLVARFIKNCLLGLGLLGS